MKSVQKKTNMTKKYNKKGKLVFEEYTLPDTNERYVKAYFQGGGLRRVHYEKDGKLRKIRAYNEKGDLMGESKLDAHSKLISTWYYNEDGSVFKENYEDEVDKEKVLEKKGFLEGLRNCFVHLQAESNSSALIGLTI